MTRDLTGNQVQWSKSDWIELVGRIVLMSDNRYSVSPESVYFNPPNCTVNRLHSHSN